MWDDLAATLLPYDTEKPKSVSSEDATAVTSAIDLNSVLVSCYREDIRSRVLKLNPTLLDSAVAMGDYPFYIIVDGGESGEQFPPSHQEVVESLKGASNADLFNDWMLPRYFPEDYEGKIESPRLTAIDQRVHDALDEAVLVPLAAKSRVVTVEGTDTVLVTFKTKFGWAMLGGAPDEAEWTGRYAVEKRNGRWVIVSMDNFADYATAQVEADLAAKNAAADKAKVKPSDAELKKAFGKGSKVTWKGQDKSGVWWASVRHDPDGLGDVYAACGYRDESGKWVVSSLGAPDGAVQVDDQFPVPDEVMAAMKKAGVRVNDVRL
jgi:hypothetical protein